MKMSQPFSVMVSSKSDEYYTPKEYVEAARRVLGFIDLDPASTNEANERTVKAHTFYDKYNDGLSKIWTGKVFLNPPFSQTVKWVNKLEQEYSKGHIEEAVLLCKAALGYKWFENLWRKYPTCLCKDRIQFIGGPGKAKQATAFVYLGNNTPLFIDSFSKYGRIILPEDQY